MSPIAELEPVLVKSLPRDTPLRRKSTQAAPEQPRTRSFVEPPELDPVLVTPLHRPERRVRRIRKRVAVARPAAIRMAVTVVGAVLGLSLAGQMVAFAAAPVAKTYNEGRAIQGMKAQIAAQESENLRLQQDIHYLKTPAGMEQEARRLGCVMPDEVALSFVTPDGKSPITVEKAAAAKAAKVSIADRIRSTVETCLAVFGSHPKVR